MLHLLTSVWCSKLVADLQDTGKMAREATFLEPMPPSTLPPPHHHHQEQPLPALEQNQQAHQPPLPAGPPAEQRHAQQHAAQPSPLSQPQAQQQEAQQQQPMAPLQAQPLSVQPSQPQMALQVQPCAMRPSQQQRAQASEVELPQAPVPSGAFEQQQFQQQPLQRALSHHQQPGSPDLPPHVQQSRPVQPVTVPQPMGQLPPREPNVQPETFMQQQLQAAQLALAMPPHVQPAGQQPAPSGRACGWEAPAAEQHRQTVPMRRHPGLAPVAAQPVLPPIHMRQHSMPHVPHGRQMAAHNAHTGLLPPSLSGPARLMDLRCAEQGQLSPCGLSLRMPAGGLSFSQLHAYGLPPGSLHGQVATFFRCDAGPVDLNQSAAGLLAVTLW